MKPTLKYVGLDVHQATTVAAVRDGRGRLVARMVLPTEGAALLEFVGAMRGTIHVAVEEGTQAQWLHDLLCPRVDRVIVCDRRGLRRQGNKGDHLDADDLAEQLRRGGLRPVYHGGHHQALRELTRAYQNLVEDTTRVMLRLKALFRARGIRTAGTAVYGAAERDTWLARLPDAGVRFRAETLYAQLDVLRNLRPKAKAAMVAEARRDVAWRLLCTIPCIGPVRASVLLATIQTPWRFRTKRHLWAYAGLAVVTHASSEYRLIEGRAVRRRRAPLTRGLNPNHNRVLKEVFKSAATAAAVRPGPLREYYEALCARGLRKELARVTLARKLAALTLRLWKTGDAYDPSKLTTQAH